MTNCHLNSDKISSIFNEQGKQKLHCDNGQLDEICKGEVDTGYFVIVLTVIVDMVLDHREKVNRVPRGFTLTEFHCSRQHLPPPPHCLLLFPSRRTTFYAVKGVLFIYSLVHSYMH